MRSVSVTTAARTVPGVGYHADERDPLRSRRRHLSDRHEPAQTGGTHFASEAYEPPGGGPPLRVEPRTNSSSCSTARSRSSSMDA